MTSFLLLQLVVPFAEGAPCAPGTTTSEVAIVLGGAESAFERRDKAAVVASADDALEGLLCLQDAVTPGFAARFHRVQGLRAFLLKEDGVASRSFAAARTLDPSYNFSVSVLPQAHPARVLYEMAPVAVASFATLPPLGGSVRLDGRDAAARPTDRPTIFQLFDDTGALLATEYLQPSNPVTVPTVPAATAASTLPPAMPAPPSPLTSPATPAGDPGPNKAMLLGGVGGLLISGVLYGIAGAVEADYDGLAPSAANRSQFEGLYATNHGLVVGAGVTAAVSVAVGAASFVVRW